LHLAGQAAEARGYPGLGRVLVLVTPSRERRVIGSIGFHGPPDDRGRLEASCRIHPSQRSRGFAAEALGALLDWSTERNGVTRFLVAVPSRREYREPVPVEVAIPATQPNEAQMDHIATLLESRPVRDTRDLGRQLQVIAIDR
jgi:GNAT superfamily N-acetyltransferase